MASVLVRLVFLTLAVLVAAKPQRSPNSLQDPEVVTQCVTAQGDEGQCVLLQHCQPLYVLFTTSRTRETRQFLNKLRCSGRKEIYSRVCCVPEPNSTITLASNSGTTHPPSPVPRPRPRPTRATTSRPVHRGTQAPVEPPRSAPIQAPVHGGTILSHPKIHMLPLEECGLKLTSKLYGGNQTDIDEFPWAALLEYEKDGKRSFECGGSLINKRYVLTAGHCSSRGTVGQYRLVGVRLGEYNTKTNPDCENDPFGAGQVCADPPKNYGIEEETVHVEYKGSTRNQYHDIALLRLDADVTFTDYIRPICIPTKEEIITSTYVGTNLTATGWGRTETSAKSSIKMKADLPVVSNADCKKVYASSGRKLASTQMCAGGVEGVDVCSGDSGGPLMSLDRLNNIVHYHITGIVSYGSTACHYGQPGVYTRVASYSSWILDNLKP